MGSIVFFPWFGLRQPFSTEDFQLIPYERGRAPFGRRTAGQRAADRIIGSYRHLMFGTGAGRPVQTATILTTSTGDPLRDRTAAEFTLGEEIAELVQFVGVADRRFFNLHYSNSDCYQMISQRFTEELDGVAPRSRRRDGGTLGYWSFKEWRVFAPDHVSPGRDEPFDGDLLRAVWQLRHTDRKRYDRLLDALVVFNRGNTDSASVPDFAEAVLIHGAFETLLGVRGGNEHEAASAFQNLFRPSRTRVGKDITARSGRPLRHKGDDDRPVRDIWFREFFRVRGSVAHGARTSKIPAVWDLPTHLLLASALFPLLLRMVLAESKVYQLTDHDLREMDCFEMRACLNHFDRRHSLGSPAPWIEACFPGLSSARPRRRRMVPLPPETPG